jgi:hypothetical protein
MLAHALTWLLAGSPPHWAGVAALVILVSEDAIARSSLRANSTLQLVFDLLGKVPVIGAALGKLGSPKPVSLDGAAVTPKDPK